MKIYIIEHANGTKERIEAESRAIAKRWASKFSKIVNIKEV